MGRNSRILTPNALDLGFQTTVHTYVHKSFTKKMTERINFAITET